MDAMTTATKEERSIMIFAMTWWARETPRARHTSFQKLGVPFFEILSRLVRRIGVAISLFLIDCAVLCGTTTALIFRSRQPRGRNRNAFYFLYWKTFQIHVSSSHPIAIVDAYRFTPQHHHPIAASHRVVATYSVLSCRGALFSSSSSFFLLTHHIGFWRIIIIDDEGKIFSRRRLSSLYLSYLHNFETLSSAGLVSLHS